MNPERPIEKLLRAFARKRRESAGKGFELHPATRRVLQGEVTRHFGRAQGVRTAWWQSWAKLWPRLAFATATLGVLVAAAVLWIPSGQQSSRTFSLAKHEVATTPPSAPLPAPRTAASKEVDLAPSADKKLALAAVPTMESSTRTAAVPSERSQEKFLAVLDASAAREAKPADGVLTSAIPAAAPPSEPARGPVLAQSAVAAERSAALAEFSKDSAAMRDTRVPVDSPPKLGLVQDRAEQGRSVAGKADRAMLRESHVEGLLFQPRSNTPGTGATAWALAPEVQAESLARRDALTAAVRRGTDPSRSVLNSFRLEQRGSEIRIEDEDGSVYTGTVQATGAALPTVALNAPAPTAARAAKSKPTAYGGMNPAGSPAASSPSSASGLTFTVRGTNATLRQSVEFVGNLRQDSSILLSPTSNQSQNIFGRYQNQISAPRQMQNQLSNSRLTGRARLANGAELEIDAVPQAANAETQRK